MLDASAGAGSARNRALRAIAAIALERANTAAQAGNGTATLHYTAQYAGILAAIAHDQRTRRWNV